MMRPDNPTAVKEEAALRFRRRNQQSITAHVPKAISPAFAQVLAAVRYAVPCLVPEQGLLLHTEEQYTAWAETGMSLPDEIRCRLRPLFLMAEAVQVSASGDLRIPRLLAAWAHIQENGRLLWLEDGRVLLTGSDDP